MDGVLRAVWAFNFHVHVCCSPNCHHASLFRPWELPGQTTLEMSITVRMPVLASRAALIAWDTCVVCLAPSDCHQRLFAAKRSLLCALQSQSAVQDTGVVCLVLLLFSQPLSAAARASCEPLLSTWHQGHFCRLSHTI